MCVAVCFPHPCHKVQFVQQEKHDVDELGRNKVSMIIYSCLYNYLFVASSCIFKG